MPVPKTRTRKEGLTSIQFEKLLLRLDSDRDSAGQRYEDLRWMLIRFFDWNSCISPEELADETFNRLAQRLEDSEIHDVTAFAWGIARKIRHEALNRTPRFVPVAEVTGEGSVLVDEEQNETQIHDRIQRERLLKCLEMCIQKLPSKEQRLFVSYHTATPNQANDRQRLARDLGLRIEALRMQVIRLRDKLRKCSEQCVGRSGRVSVNGEDAS